MRIRLLPGALIAAAAILLSACVPEFANPLAGGDAADPAVIGTWNAKAEGDDQAMLIDIKAAEGGIELVLRDPSSDGKDMTFKGSTAEVDGVRYANLTPVGPDVPEGTGYLIFRYALKDGTIQVWSLDEKAIEAAISAGKLEGTTTGTGMDLASKITADSAAVAAFFATPEGQAAFRSGPEDVLTMTRVP